MATTYGKGYNTAVEIVPESTYGTLAATGELLVYAESESLVDDKPFVENTHMAAEGAARKVGFQDRTTAGGTLTVQADYDACLKLLKCALGANATTYWSFAEENTECMSIVVNRALKRHQFTGGVIEELRIRGGQDDPKVFIEADFIFQKDTPSDTALVATALPAERILYNQMAFYIGNISDALAATDALVLANFLIRIKNSYKIEFGNGSAFIVQPLRESQRNVSLEITALRYDDDAEVTAIEASSNAGSQMQAEFVFDGAVGSNSWTVMIPNLRLRKKPHPNVSGKNSMVYQATFDCYQNDSSNATTGALGNMATCTEELEFNCAT